MSSRMQPNADMDAVHGPAPIVVVGAGGHGREVLDVIEACNTVEETWLFLGFIDDGDPARDRLERRRAEYLGGLDILSNRHGTYVIGIGDGPTRQRIDACATAVGLKPARLVHPQASIGSDVLFGPGTVVTAGVRVTTNIRIGRHVHLNLNSTITHDCVLEDYVTVNPGANISGNVVLHEGVTVGTGAAVIQGITIGAHATVGAGAVVVNNVEPGTTVVGVPAKPLVRR